MATDSVAEVAAASSRRTGALLRRDTNHTPAGIDYVIPGNDDSSRAIRLYARGMADAVLEGRNQSLEEVVSASKDEFVEVEEEEGSR